MRPFQLVRATDSRHAIALLERHGAEARLLAGGTDLLVELKSAACVPRVVIDLSRAADLKGVTRGARGLRIGAAATHAEIERCPLVREMLPALAEAVHSIGAVQTRNLGTLGGNLASAVPSMDSGPALMALDASVIVAGPRGERELTLAEFFLAPRRTALAPDELLSAVLVPAASLGKPSAFLRFGLRKGQSLALVNVAAAVWLDAGALKAPRIALGAVAPTVVRALRAEGVLEGRSATAETLAAAARKAADEAAPIDDLRASARYRRELIAVLTRRALERCLSYR